MPDSEGEPRGREGAGVDFRGDPVNDPTRNVVAILEAAVQRLNDLRAADAVFNAAESRHVRELSAQRDAYEQQLREAESKRIDAIRAVDVGNVNRAAEVSAVQATTLAAQVATSAETLRTQVAAAAAAAATALATALEPLNVAIGDLRRAQYEAQGGRARTVEARGASAAIYAAIGIGSTILLTLLALAAFLAARGGP